MSIEPNTPNPPTLPRRVLGRRLRELREEAGLSRANAARRCEMGAQTLWRLESGRNSEIKRMVVNALCDAYEASAEDRRELLWLVEESRKDGWWQSSFADAVVPEAEMFLGLEQAAREVFTWQTTTLPGLLQTHDYRYAMWEIAKPLGRSIELDREITLLQRRQARLHSSAEFTFEAALSEAALRHPIGGAETMAEQLDHLLKMTALPSVSLRVVPLDASDHLGWTTKHFVYLEFPDHVNPALTEPPVVYVEGFTGSLYLDKPSEVEQYQAARASILQVALDESETQRLIEVTAKEHRG
ncbi:helix-turn-helix transcriptional regulator [Nocardia sp. NPDC050799]|uniref:helix-turn-helix domain-containing protein n=1 Tax=Nocardia sp. NPDC050799 TaxID=3154842 RepID=UPI0033F7B588